MYSLFNWIIEYVPFSIDFLSVCSEYANPSTHDKSRFISDVDLMIRFFGTMQLLLIGCY